ncbi:hypothetical protein NIES23_20260 [Trichormus variabilis NIES-23]|uniref:Uncharacterized protein n=1 Tax=Trichormus variabilis NIES-23 TaxID=1973479 RepID=A0A1Z4KK09_ANAVA|nr:asr3605 [Nostoc sp. PCC 7120 = FACHB-418]BAY69233.1 hypothetical protein NIES23_20260 [Trichormus variabilis NIES-23]
MSNRDYQVIIPILNYQFPIPNSQLLKNPRTKIQFDLAKAVKFLKPIDSETTL